MPNHPKWTVVEARPLRESHGHKLTLARGPVLCEATIDIGYSRMVGHEPYEVRVRVDSVKVLRGRSGSRLENEVERWLAEHEEDVVTATADGPPDSPCELCNTLTGVDFLVDVSDIAPLLGFVCEACSDQLWCEDHDDSCDCTGCARETARLDKVRLAAEARVRGGLSPLGLALIGPLED